MGNHGNLDCRKESTSNGEKVMEKIAEKSNGSSTTCMAVHVYETKPFANFLIKDFLGFLCF